MVIYVRVKYKICILPKNTTPGPCVVTDERLRVMFSETSVLFQTTWCNIIKWMRDLFVSMSSSQTETPSPVNIYGIFYTRTVDVVNYVTVTTCKHHVTISLCYRNLSSHRCIQFPLKWMWYHWPCDSRVCKAFGSYIKRWSSLTLASWIGLIPRGRAGLRSVSHGHVMASPRNLWRPQVQVEPKVTGQFTPLPPHIVPQSWGCCIRGTLAAWTEEQSRHSRGSVPRWSRWTHAPVHKDTLINTNLWLCRARCHVSLIFSSINNYPISKLKCFGKALNLPFIYT